MVVSDDASDDKTKYTAWDLVARKDNNDKVHRMQSIHFARNETHSIKGG